MPPQKQAMTPSVSTGAIAFFSCFAALAHMVSGLLLALLAFGVLGEGFSYSRAKEEMLDVEYIQSKWANRQSIRGFVLAADLCAAFAWALQLPALLYLCGVLSSQHFPLAACSQAFFVAGSLVCVVEFLLNAGTQSVGAQMARSYAFEDSDWRAFEISYVLAESRNAWLLACDWFFMALGFITLGLLMRKCQPRLANGARAWANCAIALGIGASLAFLIDVASQTDLSNKVPLNYALAFLLLGLSVVLLPSMLFSLSCVARGIRTAGQGGASTFSNNASFGGSSDMVGLVGDGKSSIGGEIEL